MFELMRGDRARAAENGSETAHLAREHALPLWRAFGAFLEGLATAECGVLGEGLSDMRRVAESWRQQGLLNFDGLLKIALAQTEARAGDRVRAIATLDKAQMTADRLGYRAFEAELNRTRGEILSSASPPTPRPPKKLSRRLSPSRSGKARAVLNCAPRLHWRSSTNRPAAPPTPSQALLS